MFIFKLQHRSLKVKCIPQTRHFWCVLRGLEHINHNLIKTVVHHYSEQMYLNEGHYIDVECVLQMIGMQQWPACCRFLLMCLRLYGVTQSAVTSSTHKRPELNFMPLYRYMFIHNPVHCQANWTYNLRSLCLSESCSWFEEVLWEFGPFLLNCVLPWGKSCSVCYWAPAGAWEELGVCAAAQVLSVQARSWNDVITMITLSECDEINMN